MFSVYSSGWARISALVAVFFFVQVTVEIEAVIKGAVVHISSSSSELLVRYVAYGIEQIVCRYALC